MQREIPPTVVWSLVAVVVVIAAVLLYRAWTGGVHTYGESVPKPAPGVPGGTVPGAPGGTVPGAPGGTPTGTPATPATPPASGY
jgi:hypothetical protein